MTVLDTSVWFAFFDAQDSQNEKADAIFMDLKLRNIYLPDLVYYEILTVINIKAPDPEIAFNHFQTFIKSIGLKPQKTDDNILDLAEQYLRNTTGKLSFVDMVLLAYAQQGHRVLTFDQKLDRYLQNR